MNTVIGNFDSNRRPDRWREKNAYGTAAFLILVSTGPNFSDQPKFSEFCNSLSLT